MEEERRTSEGAAPGEREALEAALREREALREALEAARQEQGLMREALEAALREQGLIREASERHARQAEALARRVARDLEERQRAEAELERRTAEVERANRRLVEADRHKDEFLSVISHELRTPLNFIMGFASLLDDEIAGPLTGRQHEFLGKILGGAERMLLLVEDLLDLARLQAGKVTLAPSPTPYGPLVEEIVSGMAPLAAQKSLALSSEIRVAGSPYVDARRVVQVLTNLLSNALKFTPEGGRVAVRAWVRPGPPLLSPHQEGSPGAPPAPHEEWALVTEVADTGIGIPSEDLPRIFEKFHQLDMSATRVAGGAGLGLAITRALVEAQGGAMEVESTPGSGSTFRFCLPLFQAPGEWEAPLLVEEEPPRP